MRTLARLALTLLVASPFVATLQADEGMWLFNKPPRKLLAARYNFEPTDAWLEHLQKSAIRFNNGGSASFVSPDGLIITNHHVGFDCIQKLSTPERDLVRNGFRAKTRADELACPDLETNVLMSIEDVTARVNAAVKADMAVADAEAARRAVMNQIEKESTEKTGLRSDVVTLFQGAQYHLYRYKKYTDVRLVFAPEEDIAFFGGDPDNFEYPRYNLDISFFRAYENGKPAKPEHFLTWNAAGPNENELVVVAGHPGGTDRINTVAHLEFYRDFSYPWVMNYLRRLELLMKMYSERSDENARRAKDELLSVQNSRKAYNGMVSALQEPALFVKKRADEQQLRKAVEADADLRAKYAGAWDQIAKAVEMNRADFVERNLVSSGYAFNAEAFGKARTILRYVEETAKPNAERLREFRESNLESLKYGLFSEAPVHQDLELVKLADSLSMWMELRPNDPLLMQVLDGKSPRQRAGELIRGTKLDDPAVRRKLIEGGKAAVDASDDPMIRVARLVDARARELRKRNEQEIVEPLRQGYAKVANAKFHVLGDETYPDATFTLRLAFGATKAYSQDGQAVPWRTVFSGLYERAALHQGQAPWDLPKSWIDAKPKVDLAAPFDFVATIDSVGGNSGSPIVNRAGQFVGILFDGNQQTLGYQFAYQDVEGRAVAVHSHGITEALRSVYGATELVEELTPKK